ncbi:hypothetical protein RvY_00430-2 [Ramazzottius varieornatus]|uniref:Uncharacterized protein n=1 Tax=Ramazzottius varieornatus TaxID=947166 RepID=A0A1D1UK32_RAMVA|nr:hypothetical protein RvY_00430-2 [Ramazzottius varieornatus]
MALSIRRSQKHQAASVDSEVVEKVPRKRLRIIRSRRTKKVEAPEEQASVSGGSVSVATCSEGCVAGERHSEAGKPKARRRKKGQMVEWRLLNARYKSGGIVRHLIHPPFRCRLSASRSNSAISSLKGRLNREGRQRLED